MKYSRSEMSTFSHAVHVTYDQASITPTWVLMVLLSVYASRASATPLDSDLNHRTSTRATAHAVNREPHVVQPTR
ncbi:hypothetical protein DFH94DRAFT_704505 [Russula ochroleuca]|uniref:Uncharacterized protein n=1 Tax=Russula ochroleuca TaxID=152965 RepID=A0A9P5N694_9AGAM|nr:hypothetical protein DFH94DRAFT_704505 [Russula ochroleuca]